jgi:hypothetical protein
MACAFAAGRDSSTLRGETGIANHGFGMRSIARNGQKHARIAISISIHVHIRAASVPAVSLMQSAHIASLGAGIESSP